MDTVEIVELRGNSARPATRKQVKYTWIEVNDTVGDKKSSANEAHDRSGNRWLHFLHFNRDDTAAAAKGEEKKFPHFIYNIYIII